MPTYVYECSKCEKVFEVEQRIVEDALTDCQCGAKGSLTRLIQPTAIMFKGSGFYVNDSQNATNPAVVPSENTTPKVETEHAPVPALAETSTPE